MRVRGFDRARGSGLLIPSSAGLAGIGENTTEPPPPSDRPEPGVNTGPRFTMTPSGGFSTQRGGTPTNPYIIERLDISGTLNIRHSYVEVWDCRVTSSTTTFGINIASRDPNGNELMGVKVMHTKVDMVSASGGNACIGGMQLNSGSAYGDKLEVGYCELVGYADALKYADWSWIHHNYGRVRRAPGTTKHVDGFQNPGHDHTLTEYNYLSQEHSAGHNAAIFHQPYTGTSNVQIRDHIVRYNWLNGAVMTVLFGAYKDNPKDGNGKPTADHLAILDSSTYGNTFYRDYLDGVFQQRSGVNTVPEGEIARGVWFDTGEQVPAGVI